MIMIDFNSIESLKKNGFTGFQTIANLTLDSSGIPKEKGVYLIVRDKKSVPKFSDCFPFIIQIILDINFS